jgi:hypothetical protein
MHGFPITVPEQALSVFFADAVVRWMCSRVWPVPRSCSYANFSNLPARKKYVSSLSNQCLSHALAQQVGQFPCSIALL